MLETSDYRAFAAQYLDAKGQPKYDTDNLLDILEAGKAFNDAGLWQFSRDAFDQAGKLLSWKEDSVDTPQEVANLLGTTLTSDAFGAYQGKIHQGLLIDYYQAINHLMLGQEADARVDFNRLAVRQGNALTQLAAYTETVNDATRSGLNEQEDTGARKTLGEVGPKIADGIKDLPSGLSQSRIRLATGDVMAAVFRATSSASSERASNQSRDLLRSARDASATRGGSAMIAYLERELRQQRGALKDKVIVLYEDGTGPTLNEFRVDLPLFLVTDKVTYTGIALPQFVPGKPAYGALNLGNGRTTSETATLTDVNALVGLEFDVAYKGIVTKAVISTLIKTTAQAVINHQIDQQAGGLVGMLLKLGTGAVQAALTQADTRTWTNLPNTIQMAVVDRPRNGMLQLTTPTGQPVATLNLAQGVNTLVLVKASGVLGQPVIYQQQLPASEPVLPPDLLAKPEKPLEKA